MVIRSNLGVDPWDVLHVAVADLTGLSVGTVNIIVAVFVLLLWIPLGQRPGIGTLINAIWIGVSIDFGLWLIPEPPSFTMGLVMLVVATIANGLSGAIYIGTQLGPGPRDGIMTGMHYRFGWRIGTIRLVLELTVLVVGWLLGGPVGVGTVIYALGVGPTTHFFLRYTTIAVRD